jgi:hypothetical protein
MEIIHKTDRQAEHVSMQSAVKKIAYADRRLRDKNGNLVPPAVDMLNAYIRHYRMLAKNQAELGLPITHALKKIYINKRLWNQFEYWYRKMLTEAQSDAKVGIITFLDVIIEKAPKTSVQEIYHEFFPVTQGHD